MKFTDSFPTIIQPELVTEAVASGVTSMSKTRNTLKPTILPMIESGATLEAIGAVVRDFYLLHKKVSYVPVYTPEQRKQLDSLKASFKLANKKAA
jgi:hypothetical protein